MYEPVIHVPLIISVPGQRSRRDVHVPTSSLDILPTLLSLTGQPIPDTLQGRLLPGLGGSEDPVRTIFSMVAKTNSAFLPFTQGTVSITRGKHKLIHYIGYPGYEEQDELYDLDADPEEKKNRFEASDSTSHAMREELLEALHVANQRLMEKGAG
jgi:arylsulfatase A-like enzyme